MSPDQMRIHYRGGPLGGATLKTLTNIMNDFLPALEHELGQAFKVESRVERHPTLDALDIITRADIVLPAAVSRTRLQPTRLVERTTQGIIEEIVEGHLRPFSRDLIRAGETTASTWMMATAQYR
jgi:hypothetical protein